MSSLRGLMERLRPLVGEKCWDYCVFWGLSEDQRCIEFLSCCCGGADGDHQRLGEQFFPVCPVLPCRDITYQHPRTKACEALEKLPSSMPMDSGRNHSQTLFSSQPRWIFIPTMSDSEETLTTMVLIPVAGGLVELYVNKHVNEDGKIVEFVMAQCNISSSTDHEDAIQFHGQTSNAIGSSMNEEIFLPTDYSLNSNGHFRQWVPPPGMDNQPLPPWEQPLQNQPSPSSQFNLLNHDFTEVNAAHVQHSLRSSDQSLAESVVLSAGLGCDQEGIKHGGCEDGSGSIYSDQIIDEDDEDECGKGSGRSGRGQKGAKNLLAERRRRKKLNDRLYQLRSLVPIISKMDRASILIDAIAYIKKLEEQSKSLRDELEDTPDQEDGNNNNGNGENNGNNEKPTTADRGTHCGAIAGKELEAPKQNTGSPCLDDKENHMEPLVEVIPVGKEFFLKVLCEDKPRGFVRLMEAIHGLGLEVTNVNVTTYSSLALNVFRVQKRESEVVQAEQVKESLLEVTRGHAGTWLDNIERADHENGSSIDRHGSQQQHHMHHHLCDQTL